MFNPAVVHRTQRLTQVPNRATRGTTPPQRSWSLCAGPAAIMVDGVGETGNPECGGAGRLCRAGR